MCNLSRHKKAVRKCFQGKAINRGAGACVVRSPLTLTPIIGKLNGWKFWLVVHLEKNEGKNKCASGIAKSVCDAAGG
jgi:hypothetical protein